MPNTKISALPDGGALDAADEFAVARSGVSYKIDADSLLDALGTATSVRAVRAATQSISNITETPVQFNEADTFDTDGFHDPATNNTRITIPAGKAGLYLVMAETTWQQNVNNDRIMYLKVNGATYPANKLDRASVLIGNIMQVSTVVQLAVGDYIECPVYQNSGSTLTVQATWFSAVLLQSVGGASDGWTEGEALTYASATTFTVAGDQTVKYSKGTRIKPTQTTAKYFVVVGSSHAAGTTTVTITGGTDYTLASAAITLPYYSYAANPQGYPGWFTYDCSPTGFSGTPTQRASKFSIVGNICTFWLNISGTSNSVSSGITLPVTPLFSTSDGLLLYFPYVVNNNTSQNNGGIGQCTSGTTMAVYPNTSFGAWTASNAKQFYILAPFGF